MTFQVGDKSSLVQRIRRLARERSFRQEENAYVVEGPQLVTEVIESNLEVEIVAVPDAPGQENLIVLAENAGIDCVLVNERIFKGLSSTKSPQPAIAVVGCHNSDLEDLTRSKGTLLVLDEISDPGNAGTLIRSAESFGVTGVISVGGVDLYNPKVVRASAGSLFRVPCTQMESSEVVLHALSESGYSCWATTPQEGVSPESLATEMPVAVVLGSEPHGLDPTTVNACHGKLSVSTSGQAESLNVAIAGSIVLYALSRR